MVALEIIFKLATAFVRNAIAPAFFAHRNLTLTGTQQQRQSTTTTRQHSLVVATTLPFAAPNTRLAYLATSLTAPSPALTSRPRCSQSPNWTDHSRNHRRGIRREKRRTPIRSGRVVLRYAYRRQEGRRWTRNTRADTNSACSRERDIRGRRPKQGYRHHAR